MTGEKPGLLGRLSRYVLVVVLLVAFIAVATFAVLSDTSVHGLTVRFYNVSWACTSNSTNPTPLLTFTLANIVVYSSASLTTSLTHVFFSMSTNGAQVGTVYVHDANFGPNQSASYTLSFSNPALDPHAQPLSSQIGLTVNAQVTAGFYSSQASASYSQLVRFPGQPC